MKVIRFDSDRLGLLTGEGTIDAIDRLGFSSQDPLVEYIESDADAN